MTESACPSSERRQGLCQSGDVELVVLDTNASGRDAILYSTLFGGRGRDVMEDVAVDPEGGIYLAGSTRSKDLPVQNGYQPAFGGGQQCTFFGEPTACSDGFVAKLFPQGQGQGDLVLSTYLGGSGSDVANGITLDDEGNIYVAGFTNSAGFPTLDPVQPTLMGPSDAFLVKLDPEGVAVYSTYLGGDGTDGGDDVAVDGGGNAYVAGNTDSTDLAKNASELQPSFGGGDNDAFVVKVNSRGDDILYATYLGGSGDEEGSDFAADEVNVAADRSGNAYVAGTTQSSEFPIPGTPKQGQDQGNDDVFAVKIGESSQRLLVGNDGGVWSSTDGGASWFNHNLAAPDPSKALSTIQFYTGSAHPTVPGFILGGSQDNGADLFVGGGWDEAIGGDGTTSAISESNFLNVAHSLVPLMIFRSTTGGLPIADTDGDGDLDIDDAFTQVDVVLGDAPGGGVMCVKGICDPPPLRPFIGRFEMCPGQVPLPDGTLPEDVFIAGTDKVWRTNNFFSSAGRAADPIPDWNRNSPRFHDPGEGRPDFISAMAFAQTGDCRTYAIGLQRPADEEDDGEAEGIIAITRDGGGIWRWIDDDDIPWRWVTDLAFDPTDANILYASFSGFDAAAAPAGHFFKTTNALSDDPVWENKTPMLGGQLLDLPHNTIAIDPNDLTLYLGTDIGVWRSPDGGDTWEHMGPATGMPNVAVFDIQVGQQTGQVVAFTHGRGAFVLSDEPKGADLALTKMDDPDPVVQGEELTYLLKVTNFGPEVANDVVVKDTLPPGVTLLSVTPSQGTCTGNAPITCNLGNLAVGAEVQIRIVVRADTLGEICNEAEVTSSSRDPFEGNDRARQCTTVKEGEADLSVTKTDDPDPILIGRSLTYTIVVRTHGPDKAKNVVLTDVLPADVRFVSASASQGTCSGTGPITCNLGELRKGQGIRVTIVVKPQKEGEICNKASVTAKEKDPDTSNNSDTECTEVEKSDKEEADLEVTKTDHPDPAVVGQEVVYTVTLTNFGPDTAKAAGIREILPVNSDFVSATPSQGSCDPPDSNGRFFCTFGDIERGKSVTVIIVVRPLPGLGIRVFCNDVLAFSDTDDFDFNNNSHVECTEVLEGATDLSVVKQDMPDPVLVGQDITYAITVRNGGPNPATGGVLTDSLPAGVDLVSASSSQGTGTGTNPITCNLGDLAVGATVSITIIVRPGRAGTICDEASVTATEPDQDPGNNRARECTEVTREPADLAVVKRDDPDPVKAGEDLTYTLTVTNHGPGDATGVVLTDSLPPDVDLVSVSPSQGTCTGTNPITCSLEDLDSGASATVTIVVRPQIPGTICDEASVDGVEPDPNLNNNHARECTVVQGEGADLFVVKRDNPDPVLAGQDLTYSLTVTNNGPEDATGVVLTDSLPPDVDFVSANASQGSCSGMNPITCNLGNLASGATATVTIVVRPRSPGAPAPPPGSSSPTLYPWMWTLSPPTRPRVAAPA